VDLNGSLLTADAMHTQTETARIVVQQKGGDYLFTVKGNQKGVADNARELYQNLSCDFSPSAHSADL
jgi:predicted transposase YbfD/YdcC